VLDQPLAQIPMSTGPGTRFYSAPTVPAPLRHCWRTGIGCGRPEYISSPRWDRRWPNASTWRSPGVRVEVPDSADSTPPAAP